MATQKASTPPVAQAVPAAVPQAVPVAQPYTQAYPQATPYAIPATQYAVPQYLDHYPTNVVCHHCGAQVQTRTRKKAGLATFLTAAGGFIFAWPCCGCVIPFFVDPLKDTEHSCPNCSAHIGTKEVIG